MTARSNRVAAFVGSKELGFRVLQEMWGACPESVSAIVTLDDSSDSRSVLQKFTYWSETNGIPIHVLRKGSQLDAAIREVNPDLCVVAGWYHVLAADLLASVPLGFVGLHASLLPQYRGGAPLVWAIIQGEHETGVSLFHFDPGMDTGDIVFQRRISIGKADTIEDVLVRAQDASVSLVRYAYPLLLAGTAPRVSQNHEEATYCSMRNELDGRIDWCKCAEELHDFIRAQTHPYPGAYFVLNGQEHIKVWDAEPFPYPLAGPLGRVVMVHNRSIVVACGQRTGICLKIIQQGTDKAGQAVDLLRVGRTLE